MLRIRPVPVVFLRLALRPQLSAGWPLELLEKRENFQMGIAPLEGD